jgi:hypothetical protein
VAVRFFGSRENIVVFLRLVNPDISCMAWNIGPEGRYGLISSGLPGLTPSEKWKNYLVFPFFPVGRSKFLSKRNLDAAHISPGEMCGLMACAHAWVVRPADKIATSENLT